MKLQTTSAHRVAVAGRQVVVIGGGAPAALEVAALLEAGAVVTVVADQVTATLQDLAERQLITWQQRRPHADDLTADLIIRTDDPAQPAESAVAAPTQSATADARSQSVGTVTLVGAGPGDPDLLTVAAQRAIAAADVVVSDRLVPHSVVRDLAPHAEVIDVAKVPRGPSTPQERINVIIVEHALAGRDVVRLKGGDPYVFGRGGEELLACTDADIPTRVIPGVTSSIAGPALAGIPVTHRGLTQGFTVISGHVPPEHPDSTIDYAALAAAGTTIVVLMGVRTLEAICAALVAGGLDPSTPAAVVADASLPSQREVRADVRSIARVAADASIGAPAVAVIGQVADPAQLAAHGTLP